MWVEKDVFYEQNRPRGREEEPPGKVGTVCQRGGGLCPHGVGGTLHRMIILPRRLIYSSN